MERVGRRVAGSKMEDVEGGKIGGDESDDGSKYARELDVAVRVLHMVSSLCRSVQEELLSTNADLTKIKDDNSLVTVADWSVQAVVSWMLSETFGSENVSIIAEEDVQTLLGVDSIELLDSVVNIVNKSLADALRFGLERPKEALNAVDVLEAISRCNSIGGPTGRHWVLDPVDGTLGFARGNQYAIALAMIEEGEVVLGVLGCPNYPVKKDWLNCRYGNCQMMSKSPPSTLEACVKGCVLYAQKGTREAWMSPMLSDNSNDDCRKLVESIHVSSVDEPALATFCEPAERANSSHSFTEGLAQCVGLRNRPLRLHSMVKYAAIARGDAEIFMKFAMVGYKEKVWDHAAGIIIVQEAGGVVTDAGGRSLDFSKGLYLEDLDRGIVACSGAALHEKIIKAVYDSWDSSNL